jgi:hypothetical protein
MSNDPAAAPSEESHLEPLPDLPLEASSTPAPAAPRSQPGKPGAPNVSARAQERAPQMLLKAAKLLVAGSLLPWMGADLGSGNWVNLGLKLVLLGGCMLIMKGVDAHYAGASATGFGAKPLAAGKKGMLGALNGLHVVGTLVILGVLGAQLALYSDHVLVLGESATLLLGGLTFAHIHSYLKGGHFNPLFPIMFAGCAIGGLFGLFGRIQQGGALGWLGALGCLILAAAGAGAVHTIAVAMMQAKKEGEVKKAAALEARKAARATSRGPGGAARG